MKFSIYITFFLFLFSCGTKKNTHSISENQNKGFSKLDYPYIEKFHEGIRYKQKRQFLEAITIFESCLLLNPNDDAVYYALSELYLETKQLAKSSEAIKKAVELDPNNKWYLQEYAYMLFEAKNYKESAKAFKTLSQIEPKNIDWLFSYAQSLANSNDFSGAIKTLDKLEFEIGVNPDLSLEKFRLYRKTKQEEKAANEIIKALEIYPSNPQLLANLVDFYFEKKQEEKAFSYLIKLSETDPTNGNAHLALAQYYDQKGERKKSYEELIKAFSCDDILLDTKVKILLSMFEFETKVDDELSQLANILVDKYPNDAVVYTVRGDFYLKEKKEREALLDFKAAIKLDQSKFAIWEQILLLDYKNQDYKSLYEDSKKCLEYFSAISKVYLFFGIAAIQEKKYDEAIEKLIAGEELVVNDNQLKAEFFAQKGDAYFALKKIKEGKDSYEKALKFDERNILFKNNYAYRLALAKTDLDKAELLIKEVIEVSPNEANFLDTYGWVLFQKGKFEDALHQFEDASKISPNNKHIVEHIGDVFFKLGKIEDAVKFWKKAKEMGSTNLKINDKIERKNYYDPQY